MTRIPTMVCHAIRPGPQETRKNVQVKLAAAREMISTWRASGAPGWERFQDRLNQLAKAEAAASDDSATSRKALEALDTITDDFLKQVDKQAVIKVDGFPPLNAQILGLDKMPVEDRPKALADLRGKLHRGRLLARMVTAPDFDPNSHTPTQEDVSDLTFFLRARSEDAAGEPWMRGAMTLPDPNGKIRQWLDRVQGHVYTRSSSHLATSDKQASGGQARGMDFDQKGDLSKRLPYGMRTLLFQQFQRDGQDYLYLKMETEGARFNPKHVPRLRPEQAGPSKGDIRPLRPGDVPEAIRHLKNLIIKEKDESGLARHGEKFEDLPGPVRNSYQDLFTVVGENDDLKQGLSTGGSFEDGALSEMEVSQMARNVDELERYLQSDAGQKMDPEERRRINEGIQGWRAAAQTAWGPNYADQVGHRVGNEVILTSGDLRA